MLRTYRLAVAATGEYSAFHGGTTAGAMAAIATTINRVNEIYEQDLTVRFILIANNDQLIYLDPNSDPYDNGNPFSAINANQVNLDMEIGSANYDVGHVFTTGAGGLAGLGVLCDNGGKARGVTGIGAPVGDPFDIDFVSHEIGHQFGGPHTFNGTQSNCSGSNRSNANAFEPGSGTTIMAYAGICGSDNVQNNSDAYFHAKSIESMMNVVLNTNCSNTIPSFANTAPSVASLASVVVPASTPLVLEAVATDADNDVLTYCWEQIDAGNGNTALPNPNNTSGPLFRSLFHNTSPKRFLPSIDNIIDGTNDEWEVLPGVSRALNFRVTVRDNGLNPGCTDEEDFNIQVDGNSGPFVVNNTSIPAMVSEGQTVSLSWDVAGTNAAPVSCANVEILMSNDGGNTYPIVLLSQTANDGAAEIQIPTGVTTTARIMVKCADNIFFDINDSDFEVEQSVDGFLLSLNPALASECNVDNASTTVNTVSIAGFSNPIQLSASNLPPGAVANFSVNPVAPGASSVLTLSNLTSSTGQFDVTVSGNAGAFSRESTFAVTLFEPSAIPLLTSPADNAIDVPTALTLNWTAASNAQTYEYEVSTSPNGVGIVSQGMTTSTSVELTGLDLLETYFWRIRSVNECGMSNYSNEFTFTTANETEICQVFSSTDTPLTITDATPVQASQTNSFITVSGITGPITDVNVLNLQGTHTFVSDLVMAIFSPNGDGTQVTLFSGICESDDDFDLNFDDEAGAGDINCPPTDGSTFQPLVPFSTWEGEDANGSWLLGMLDRGFRDEGTLNNWDLEVCYIGVAPGCDLTVDSDAQTGPGTLMNALNCANSGDIIVLESSLSNQTINLATMKIVIDKDLTIQADPSDNISIAYSGNEVAITINQGIEASLQGFTLLHSSPLSEAIQNNGVLNIENVVVDTN